MSLGEVGTVVLHYRRLEHTRRCLSSLARLDYPGHRTLLVDNASGDGSAETLAGEFPGVEQLRLERNLGYTGGNNRGIERLLDDGVAFVQVLNDDVEVIGPGYLAALVEAMGRHARWGAAGPRVFLGSRDRVQKTWVGFPTLAGVVSGSVRAPAGTVSEDDAPREEMEVEAANGVCLLLRAEAVREVGGFDEDLFMYVEEQDLCYRLARRGWKTGHVPVPALIHYQQEARPGFGLSHDLARANQVRFLRNHRGRAPAAVAALWLAATGVAKAPRLGPGLGGYLGRLWGALHGRPARRPAPGGTAP